MVEEEEEAEEKEANVHRCTVSKQSECLCSMTLPPGLHRHRAAQQGDRAGRGGSAARHAHQGEAWQ